MGGSRGSKGGDFRSLSWTAKFIFILNNISLEPFFFFSGFANELVYVTTQQMQIHKACRIDLNYSASICDTLLEDGNEGLNKDVQDTVAKFGVYLAGVTQTPTIFLAFYYGVWVDAIGRKTILHLHALATVVSQLLLVLNGYFLLEWPNYFYILTVSVPIMLVGGKSTSFIASTAFITDISPFGMAALRLGILHVCQSISEPLANIVGAYLLKKGGFAVVFLFGFIFSCVAYVFLYICLNKYDEPVKKKDQLTKEESSRSASIVSIDRFHSVPASESTPEKSTKKTFWELVSPRIFLDCFRVFFKRRPGKLRMILFISLANLLLILTSTIGEATLSYLYVRTRYKWDVTDYSFYKSVDKITAIIAQSAIIPILGLVKVNNENFLLAITLSFCLRHLSMGLAYESWMYYAGTMLDVLGSYAFSIIRATTSEILPKAEMGKVLAMVISIENICIIAAIKIYQVIWEKTDQKMPGTVYFVSSFMCSCALAFTFFLKWQLKGRSVSEYYEEVTGKDRDNNDITSSKSSSDRGITNQGAELDNL